MDFDPSALPTGMKIPEDSAGQATPVATTIHPYDAYLARLSPEAKTTMRGCLDRIARIHQGAPIATKDITGRDIDWWATTPAQAGAIRSAITTQGWAPATVNKHLCAYRQVLHESWRLGLMDADARDRAKDVQRDKGTRLPAGRSIADTERDALLSTCDEGEPKDVRDAAVIALLYVTGARRSELVRVDLDDWSAVDRSLRILGKRDKERLVSVSTTAIGWLDAWFRLRGWQAGPLFCPVLKNGRVVMRRLTGQTMRDILDRRCTVAGIRHATPHDFRRSVVGDLLDSGADLAIVQRIAGHASPKTTAGYDRRPQRAQLEAVDRLTLRQPGEAPPPARDDASDQP